MRPGLKRHEAGLGTRDMRRMTHCSNFFSFIQSREIYYA